MLALAIGDALGAPVEFLRRRQILSRFGSQGISELEPWGSQPAGAYTDDTQMSVATARGILDWRAVTGWSPGVDRIIEYPSFRDSAESYHAQVADLIAFLLYQELAPSASMRKTGGQSYFRRLAPLLLRQASSSEPQGMVRL